MKMRCKLSASFLAALILHNREARFASEVCNKTFASRLEPINFLPRAISRTLFTSVLSWRHLMQNNIRGRTEEPLNGHLKAYHSCKKWRVVLIFLSLTSGGMNFHRNILFG